MEVHNHNHRMLLNSFCEPGGSQQGLDNWLCIFVLFNLFPNDSGEDKEGTLIMSETDTGGVTRTPVIQ